ncbi:DNA-directed RNA polymerase II, putative [Plasmodium sp. gorilla clade G2]|uniref:DNA-directed RNA polymerase II, putative n=1 Tax=Plasmodium sp. gorilla clade G2 TaxID=880535 RepID=UPI000D20BA69|nr:DNA-directed RNA polymerase II, putative [Plasmodium sp. gorilla clade G2]SOV18467.1 DNA-directed RNA polymerase II, putative [Plasmodium sp. gorilla clade G2]
MEDPITRFYKCRKTCCEMLEDRGYIITPREKLENFSSFKEMFEDNDRQRSKMGISTSHKNDANNRIIVYFADEVKKTGVKPLRELTERMEEKSIQRAILVTQNILTPFARDAIKEAAPRHIIENFLDTELLVNITKHELVPRHIPLTSDEKKNLLQRYKIMENKLPRIQDVDPVCRYFGLSKGQVVKIIRPSETAGRYVTYRLVV